MDRFTLSHLADHDLVAALRIAPRARERRTLADLSRTSPKSRRDGSTCSVPVDARLAHARTRVLVRRRVAAAAPPASRAASLPQMFAAVAEGALDLTAVLLLAPELTRRTRRRAARGGIEEVEERDPAVARTARARPTPQLPLPPTARHDRRAAFAGGASATKSPSSRQKPRDRWSHLRGPRRKEQARRRNRASGCRFRRAR